MRIESVNRDESAKRSVRPQEMKPKAPEEVAPRNRVDIEDREPSPEQAEASADVNGVDDYA